MSYFPPIMARGMGKGSIEDLSCKTKKIKPNILVRTILKQIHVKKYLTMKHKKQILTYRMFFSKFFPSLFLKLLYRTEKT